ncbi:MAG: phosphoribosylanthranilate isomerase [Nitrososphaerota archaeon]|jgi:phosphoribosylanthranilate isomerase|nr:phosphoribosylanthranilate isomerase [Nitrososphaerota archaeon]
MVRVKICGITRQVDLRAAVEAGVDAVGFIAGFPESPRNISLERVTDLSTSVPPFVSAVLVTTETFLKHNLNVISKLQIDTLQLYDCSDPVPIRETLNVDVLRPYIVGHERVSAGKAVSGYDGLVVDSYRSGLRGGTGVAQDFDLCSKIKDEISPKPLILAGGVGPDNVVDAVKIVRPYGVDASSRLERSPGIKDPLLMKEFVKRAKESDGVM